MNLNTSYSSWLICDNLPARLFCNVIWLFYFLNVEIVFCALHLIITFVFQHVYFRLHISIIMVHFNYLKKIKSKAVRYKFYQRGQCGLMFGRFFHTDKYFLTINLNDTIYHLWLLFLKIFLKLICKIKNYIFKFL